MKYILDFRSNTFIHLLALFLLGSIIFLPALGQEKLISYDEVAHAEIAREMLENGEYIVPHLLGHLYKDKPPSLTG